MKTRTISAPDYTINEYAKNTEVYFEESILTQHLSANYVIFTDKYDDAGNVPDALSHQYQAAQFVKETRNRLAIIDILTQYSTNLNDGSIDSYDNHVLLEDNFLDAAIDILAIEVEVK